MPSAVPEEFVIPDSMKISLIDASHQQDDRSSSSSIDSKFIEDQMWGFRITGGAEFNMPITVFHVRYLLILKKSFVLRILALYILCRYTRRNGKKNYHLLNNVCFILCFIGSRLMDVNSFFLKNSI